MSDGDMMCAVGRVRIGNTMWAMAIPLRVGASMLETAAKGGEGIVRIVTTVEFVAFPANPDEIAPPPKPSLMVVA